MNPREPRSIAPPPARSPKPQPWKGLLIAVSILWFAGGATCHRRDTLKSVHTPPVLFAEKPSLEQLITAVNRSDSVTKMQSPSATVEVLDTSSSVPKLNATLAIERPDRIRIRTSVPIVMSEGLDIGSNAELFWLRYPEGLQRTLLFARHAEYAQNIRWSPIPVDPRWLIEALGLVHLDPKLVQEEPTQRPDGHWELRTLLPQGPADAAAGTAAWGTGAGAAPFHRVLMVDREGGFVRAQFLYNPDGRLVARTWGEDYRYYSDPEVVLPHTVQLQMDPAGAAAMSLRIEVGSYVLNQLLGADPNLFQMPTDGNHQVVDLSRVAAPLAGAPQLPTLERVPVAPGAPDADGGVPALPGNAWPAGPGTPYLGPVPANPGEELPQVPGLPEIPSSLPALPAIPFPGSPLEAIPLKGDRAEGTHVQGVQRVRDYVTSAEYAPALRGTQLR